ncbi:MAG: thymidylate synthase, partial [Pseudomonadota bacterium]
MNRESKTGFEIVQIIATSLPDAWFQCIWEVLDKGHTYTIDLGSFEGQQRLEFDYITVQIRYPRARPLIPDIPAGMGMPNPVADGYIEEYLPYLMTSNKKPGEDYTYGQCLERQIPEVIKMYRDQGPGTNQACMSVGNADSIFLKDPQCLRLVDTRIRYGKLHFI